jgi:hypothetical protein
MTRADHAFGSPEAVALYRVVGAGRSIDVATFGRAGVSGMRG